MHLPEETIIQFRDALLAALEGESNLLEPILDEMETGDLEVLYSAVCYLKDEIRNRLTRIYGEDMRRDSYQA